MDQHLTRRGALGIALIAATVAVTASDKVGTFSLPNSVLLFNESDHLRLVTPGADQRVSLPVDLGWNRSDDRSAHNPDFSPTGQFIAWGFAVAWDDSRRDLYRARYALGIYFLAQHAWKVYGDFDSVGPIAIAPDGLRIAAVVQHGRDGRLMLFDVATGTFSPTSTPKDLAIDDLSWSPEGQRLVTGSRCDGGRPVTLLDPVTGRVDPLALGCHPSWSPTGEWIAYIDPTRLKTWIVHPDGTAAKVVREHKADWFHVLLLGYREFMYGAVWSPDGTQLLLNEFRGDGPYLDAMLLDLTIGRTAKMRRNSLAVRAWTARVERAGRAVRAGGRGG